MHLLLPHQIKEISGGFFPFDLFFPDAIQPSPLQTVVINTQASPDELSAIAYTASNNCYFDSTYEKNLLAHECAHLVQQNGK